MENIKLLQLFDFGIKLWERPQSFNPNTIPIFSIAFLSHLTFLFFPSLPPSFFASSPNWS